jgi:hypothetical protein
VSLLLAGAGKAEIGYTLEMLPTYGENYNAIHDLPMVQVLLLEYGERFAILSVDAVMLEIRDQLLNAAQEELGLDRQNILLHATHVLAAPHFRQWSGGEEWMRDPGHSRARVTAEEAARFAAGENRLVQAHVEAVRRACIQARDTLQIASFGIGTAHANVTVNRVIETKAGWWQGVNPDGPTDQTVPVLRFDGADGKTIALLYNVNVAPGCMEFSQVGDGRMVSGDLAGASQRFIDRVYGEQVVSIYTTGATGDQWQALRARMDYLNRDGNQAITDLGERGFALVEILAARLGEQVVRTADRIQTARLTGRLTMRRFSFSYPGQRVETQADWSEPTRACRFVTQGQQNAEIAILALGDTALVACGVELCVESLKRIKEGSPFAHTVLLEFAAEGGGYMPPEIFYDRMGFQARKCRYAKGSAERFVEDVIDSLNKVHRIHTEQAEKE